MAWKNDSCKLTLKKAQGSVEENYAGEKTLFQV